MSSLIDQDLEQEKKICNKKIVLRSENPVRWSFNCKCPSLPKIGAYLYITTDGAILRLLGNRSTGTYTFLYE